MTPSSRNSTDTDLSRPLSKLTVIARIRNNKLILCCCIFSVQKPKRFWDISIKVWQANKFIFSDFDPDYSENKHASIGRLGGPVILLASRLYGHRFKF